MNAFTTFLMVWLAAAIAMSAACVVARRRNNMGWVDVYWSLLMALSAAAVALLGSGDPLVRIVLAVGGGLWGLRLYAHLAHRVANEAEDGRYQSMRSATKDGPLSWWLFFQLQAFVIALFSLPFIAAAAASDASGLWLALPIWAIAIGGESLADRQLQRHRENPGNRGRSCRTGLWAWSRHPNYFFEWLH